MVKRESERGVSWASGTNKREDFSKQMTSYVTLSMEGSRNSRGSVDSALHTDRQDRDGHKQEESPPR